MPFERLSLGDREASILLLATSTFFSFNTYKKNNLAFNLSAKPAAQLFLVFGSVLDYWIIKIISTESFYFPEKTNQLFVIELNLCISLWVNKTRPLHLLFVIVLLSHVFTLFRMVEGGGGEVWKGAPYQIFPCNF